MSDIKWAIDSILSREPGYRIAQQYYNGEHKLTFATERFRNAFGSFFSAFADNLCGVVVDTLADRLIVIGFGAESGEDVVPGVAWGIWQENRMGRKSRVVHRMALRDGDAYVIVWPGQDGLPMIHPNCAIRMSVAYSDEGNGEITRAARMWRLEDGRIRLNLYYPDRIEKYVTSRAVDGTLSDARGYVPLEDEPVVPNPWGQVPVFHFANDSTGESNFGRSALADVIPLQNALNKSVADMLVAMEYVSLPQRWATGLEVEVDPVTGKPKAPFTPGVERIWTVGDPDVRFGQFDPANLKQFLEVQNSFRAEIARVSGVPFHYLMLDPGGWPSGEAMKTAEARLTTIVTNLQETFGDVWEDCMSLALRMREIEGDYRLSTVWEDAAPRNPRAEAETALLKQQVGVSREQLLAELGYSPEEIERMAEERTAGDAELGEKLLTQFERGV
ncbi:MAG: hypothetical protein DRO14_00590 [Thermoprotei archaeon]|nr:MAG: hypothetical protein DRO14_00590 [Thermoprotei archaeon]